MRFSLRSRSAPGPATGEAHVEVCGGYEPSTIVARAGEPLRIGFTRHETSPCSERVVFPDFGVEADLPPHEEVVVELLPREPGEFEFTCGMGMLRGRLVVQP
jgi:plastocyanin domain-containing protein